jgi:hypothetical protein
VHGVQVEWEPEELIEAWTLGSGDWALVGNKAGATRLGFVALLKFYELEGRFPAYAEEVPPAAVEYLASLVKVDLTVFLRPDRPGAGRAAPASRGSDGRPTSAGADRVAPLVPGLGSEMASG